MIIYNTTGRARWCAVRRKTGRWKKADVEDEEQNIHIIHRCSHTSLFPRPAFACLCVYVTAWIMCVKCRRLCAGVKLCSYEPRARSILIQTDRPEHGLHSPVNCLNNSQSASVTMGLPQRCSQQTAWKADWVFFVVKFETKWQSAQFVDISLLASFLFLLLLAIRVKQNEVFFHEHVWMIMMMTESPLQWSALLSFWKAAFSSRMRSVHQEKSVLKADVTFKNL